MDILHAFQLNGHSHQINIKGTIEEPLFQANQVGKLLEIRNIHTTIRDFDNDEKVIQSVHTLGGTQNVVFLTELGLYRLLGMSKKPVARIFQKWVSKVVKELRLKGKYELSQSIETERNLSKARVEMERHRTFVHSFHNKRILYFTKLKAFNETRDIIKIGWSNNIEARQRALVEKFGDSYFKDVFECHQNAEFELSLKKNPDFARFQYTDDIIDSVRSTETFLLNEEEYVFLLTIVKRNVQNYQGFNPEQFLQKKRLDISENIIELLKNDPQNTDLQSSLLYSLKSIKNNEVMKLEDQDTLQDGNDETSIPLIGEVGNMPRENTRNRKVQQYDPISFELLNTYSGIMDVIRKNPNMSKVGVKSAAIGNTIYYGCRWYLLEVGLEDKHYDIPQTIDVHSSIPRHIAMLDVEKTRIESCFVSLGDAANTININRKSTICDAIRDDKPVKGLYYFKYFQDCSDTLKSEYLARNQLPIMQLPKGTKVCQIDVSTKQEINRYASISDVLKQNCISRASLKRACANGETHKGFLWKIVE
jgi:prophage antirepressor-like protein